MSRYCARNAPFFVTAPTFTSSHSIARRLVCFWLSEQMLLIGTAGFLAGYLVMWNVELQLLWQAAVCLPAFIAVMVRTRGGGLVRDPVLRLAAVFLVWNLGVGLTRNAWAFADYYSFEFLAGSLLLPAYLCSLWLLCRRPGGARTLQLALAWSALAAAVAGLIYWRCFQVAEMPGARLRNPLVHGGQHPVSTGMCLAFAALAGVACYTGTTARWHRAALLGIVTVAMVAVMLTLSRGPLLALFFAAAGMMGLLLLMVRNARLLGLPFQASVLKFGKPLLRMWPPFLAAAIVAATFPLWGGLLAPKHEIPEGLPPGQPVVYLGRLNANPVQELIARADSGRHFFYRLGLAQMDTWDKHLTGAGLWGPETKLEQFTGGGIDHFHSIYVATYVHGGVIGAALLVAILVITLRRALHLAHRSEPEWLALLAFGMGGLIFDGQSLCSLVTHPRFENLILWFPIVAIAARPGAPPSRAA